MIRILFLTLVVFSSMTLRGQQTGVNPDDAAFIEKYADLDFHGKFALAIFKDSTNRYYLVDFTDLPDRFERVYFMNQSFLSGEIINIDPDITKARVCFMSNIIYDEADVLKIFDKRKAEAVAVESSWTDDQKSAWLKENDKYRNSGKP